MSKRDRAEQAAQRYNAGRDIYSGEIDLEGIQDNSAVYRENEELRAYVNELEAKLRDNQIVPADTLWRDESGVLNYNRVRMTNVGLDLPADITRDELTEMGRLLGEAGKAVAWWIGDWANAVPGKWGEKYQWLVEVTGINKKTIRNYASVARKVHLSQRRGQLSWAHHRLVTRFDVRQQKALLQRAIKDDLTEPQFKALIDQLSGRALPAPIDHVLRTVNQLRNKATKMEAHERRQMATALRQLADEIERTDE